jgi:FdhD protein
MSSTAPRRSIVTVHGDQELRQRDRLAGEEPMEIRVRDATGATTPVAVTMRTPGHDFDLAVGFLITEGVIAPGSVTRVAYCEDARPEQRFNVVTVTTSGSISLGHDRQLAMTSACGICGKSSLDAIEVRCDPVADGPVISRTTLIDLPDALRGDQKVFDATGGLHAAGLFDIEGKLHLMREDIGRHNAVDAVIGAAAMSGELPLADRILMVSGRAGFEIVQKAAVAGIPIMAAVSAPSSLAADAAERLGLTLVGFLRGDGFNIYTHPERILL